MNSIKFFRKLFKIPSRLKKKIVFPMFRSVQLALFKSSNKTEKVIIYTVQLWLCICCAIQGLA